MKHAKKALDILWELSVKRRDHYRCKVCGSEGTDAHHILSRRNSGVRWMLDNGITLCRECHVKATDKRIVFEVSNDIRAASRVICKFSKDDFDRLRKMFKKYLAQPGVE